MRIPKKVTGSNLDDSAHIEQIRLSLKSNHFLRKLYEDIYKSFVATLKRHGLQDAPQIIELGAGGSFLKAHLSQVKTTDVLPYDGIDFVVDGLKMPFENGSVDAFFLMNVVHHVPDAEGLFRELNRCLQPEGLIFIFDQNVNFFSRLIFKYLHHEHFDDNTSTWAFHSTGALSSANGALAWILFCRDRKRFESLFNELSIISIRTRYPWAYWLSGGLQKNLGIPSWLFPLSSFVEKILTLIFPKSGSFLEVVLKKKVLT